MFQFQSTRDKRNNTTSPSLFQRWLARRLPPNPDITLSHRSIFILPSGFGLVWLALVLLLYIFGTNYQNNLVIGLSILLLSVFNTTILYSYKNLAGLRIRALTPPEVYAGETITFPLQLNSSHTSHNIHLSYPNNLSHVLNQVSSDDVLALVPFEYPKRGRILPGRLSIESFYPLGLCKAWSHLDLGSEHIIYAKPIAAQLALDVTGRQYSESPTGKNSVGIDEFRGLKPHVLGESLKQVAWKRWAQGRGLLTKEFEQSKGEPMWLKLTPDAAELETQLSQLSWQVNRLSLSEHGFGLLLPMPNQHDIIIPPATGNAHRIACQRALALYGDMETLNRPHEGLTREPKSARPFEKKPSHNTVKTPAKAFDIEPRP